jgi:hypothetical protein
MLCSVENKGLLFLFIFFFDIFMYSGLKENESLSNENRKVFGKDRSSPEYGHSVYLYQSLYRFHGFSLSDELF